MVMYDTASVALETRFQISSPTQARRFHPQRLINLSLSARLFPNLQGAGIICGHLVLERHRSGRELVRQRGYGVVPVAGSVAIVC